MKTAFKLAEMQKIADEVIETIAPFCEKVEIAGSIRRQKPTVSDIEIIYIPKYKEESKFSLFNDNKPKLDNMLRNFVNINPNFTKRLNKLGFSTFGRKIQLMLYKNKYPVDLFVANRENWAVTKLIRTGSKEFNIFLLNEAPLNGFEISLEKGYLKYIKSEKLIYPQSEQEIFAILGIDYLPPEQRNALQKFKRDYR